MNKQQIYKIANKEAIYACILAVAHFIWWFAFAYGLGSENIENYHYIFGFPAWFFYSSIVGLAVIIIAVILLVKYCFTEVDLDISLDSRLRGNDDKVENL